MTTTRAGFLRGLFSLGADLVGGAAGVAADTPDPADTAESGGHPAAAAPPVPFHGGAPLCGPGGDFTPELLRLEAERMGLPADADPGDLLHHLHRAMLDMAPPGVRASGVTEETGEAAPGIPAAPDATDAGHPR
ncbi:hypothetical protein [Nitratidesulfovibrio sp. 1201_IL3209]|uniref:hypothetical protein n=1 Tax=Nitratidesulfovibrio sp. 1201_IL3209 TaxID=3084053 RepID=UPI002FDA8591